MVSRSLLAVTLTVAAGLIVSSAQEQAPNRRDITIVARDHQFVPARIEVIQNDLVRVTLKSEGHPHSFAIDAYRIAKRVNGGQTIVFEFRADRAGNFTYYCNMTSDPACKDMRGTLVVAPK
jgi:cytochrome c oxidase subunit 2